MTMFEITAILWRRKILLVGMAVLIFAIGAGAVLASRHTTYTASSQVLFDQPGLEVTQGGATVPSKITNLIPTFCKLIDSEQVAAAASANAGVSIGVAASVRCSLEAGTLVVLLQYTNANGTMAQKVVASVATQLSTTVQQRYNQPGLAPGESLTADIITPSFVRRDSHGTTRGLGLVAIAAVVVSAALALAVEPHRKDWGTTRPPVGDAQD